MVVLSNAGEFDAHDISKRITDLYLKDYLKEDIKGEDHDNTNNDKEIKEFNRYNNEDLKAIEGNYYSDELGVIYKLEAKDKKIVIKQRRVQDRYFNHIEEDFFKRDGGVETIKILHNTSKKVTGFLFNGSNVRNLEFDKL